MAYTNPLQGNPDAANLRRQAGKYLRELREAANMTQQELARSLGMDYYTTVSGIELGRGRVPPDKIKDWARLLGVDQVVFAKRLLQFYDPYMWDALYGKGAKTSSETADS